MSEDEKARHDSDYESLLALFVSLLKLIHTDQRQEALYELAERRAEIAIGHAARGLGIDIDEALMLLHSKDDHNLTKHDKDLRDRIEAAILNLIDFSVCEEYQLYDEVTDFVGDSEVDFDSDEYDELLALCRKYNDSYAAVENGDIFYAATVAAKWIRFSMSEYLMYWTQNDAKVRPSHMALQGYAAHVDEFPSWMIPPIEYNCRCFLLPVEMGAALGELKKIKGSVKDLKKPAGIDDVYSESLAKCGRIFGPSHSYFQVKEADKEMLDDFVERLRNKYYGREEI